MKLEDATFNEFVVEEQLPIQPPGQQGERLPVTFDAAALPTDEFDEDEDSLAEALNQELETDLCRAVGLLGCCRDIFDQLLGSKRLLDRLGSHRVKEMRDCAIDVAAFMDEWSFLDPKELAKLDR